MSLSKEVILKIKKEILKGTKNKQVMKKFNVSKSTVSRIKLMSMGYQSSYFNELLEGNKEKYLPFIKNKCCRCEKEFENNWKHYKCSGNFCGQCLSEIRKLPKPSKKSVESFHKLLLGNV